MSTILDILVPNPTSESSEIDKMEIIENQSKTDHKSMTTMNSFDSLRLHGCLPGSSSGFGLGSTLTIEIQLPCNSQVNSSRASFEPKIYIKRSTETKELEESATTFARLAAEKHRPKLTNYLQIFNPTLYFISKTSLCQDSLRAALPANSIHIYLFQTLESTHSMNFASKLSSKRNEKIEILKQWISRIQTLTSLFYDRIEFIDSEPIHRVNNPARTSSISSDDSDFEEVVSTTLDTGKSPCYPSSLHENLSCGRIESINTRSLSVVDSDPNQQIVQLTNEDQPKSRKHGTVVTSSTQNFISCDVTTNPHTASWRDSESVHRFWKPIDPDEYNRPKEYLDSAVSWFSTNDTQCCPPNIHPESANTFEFTENEIKDIDFTVAPRRLFCWAPLLSGSLCHRCDPSGRCPIHGRIVKRDKITGRPINMNDRKLIQTEMEAKRLARQKSEFSCSMV
ncbi:unnamed protein product [Schistosoma margrebowiei]|uniref:UV-stimulated scaffold protein A C-terminal domain-containing protein n=1 Tax=Schistosoma margrebowiei TaxID=48269 RepID=A0A3P8EPX1_9TREM|nr:unnamed protein product [Schistosoma margrebowiei]